MTLAATFLGGAKSRLLPASVPFRFFAAAALFHVLMWVALIVGAEDAPSFRGGLGPMLAVVHLLTLGVLATTAIGASVQLLPVATRRSLAAVWPIKAVFWLVVPGQIALLSGMYAADTVVMIAGALAATAGLLLYAGLLADNLWRARSLPVVSAYGWAALGALVVLVALGLALAVDYETTTLTDHPAIALAHMLLSGFGFMGMLAIGFSHVLVPMFALAAVPDQIRSFAAFAAAVAAIILGVSGALLGTVWVMTAAAVFGIGAVGVHLSLMLHVLATGMRKRLGISFVLIRASWLMLAATLLVGLAALHGMAGPNGPTLFGLFLLGGWLLTFVLGVLQRILPFLASMHAARSDRGLPPLLSELAATTPLKLHAACHGLALAGLSVAIVVGNGMLVRVAALVGLVGSVAFAWFTASVIRRLFPRDS